jgi:hypothetical protein
MSFNDRQLSRARESRTAIEKLYVEMRHLVNRGVYRPMGSTGKVIRESLLDLSPEIYGSMHVPEKVELDGLVYVIDRLPRGIESCRFIHMISEEGYEESGFPIVVPSARRRNCYRIDDERMYIEVTRGRSEIYDILTHLTFLFFEADKIKENALNEEEEPTEEWKKLEEIVQGKLLLNTKNQKNAYAYLSKILGRTYEETKAACQRLDGHDEKNSGLFAVVYWLGKLAMEEEFDEQVFREISFSPTLRERIGHHLYGERWATNIKAFLMENDLIDRPIHIISANMHSIMNCLYAPQALREFFGSKVSVFDLAKELSLTENGKMRERVESLALANGMQVLESHAGTHIKVQIIDTLKLLDLEGNKRIGLDKEKILKEKPVLLIMDYAFGEQAYETLDELLKTYPNGEKEHRIQVASISVMGKAGILEGGKGDLMIPDAFVFEGTADNYPLENEFKLDDFQGNDLQVFDGPMITVLGTSLQNRDILAYFKQSSWQAIGLEMEGAHYQKAIQSQVRIRKNVDSPVQLRYAYYASDNPLETGSTLASGSLGMTGVKPAYLISLKILEKILGSPKSTKTAANGRATKKQTKKATS